MKQGSTRSAKARVRKDIEWFDVTRRIRPDLSEVEVHGLWDRFQNEKLARRLKAKLQ